LAAWLKLTAALLVMLPLQAGGVALQGARRHGGAAGVVVGARQLQGAGAGLGEGPRAAHGAGVDAVGRLVEIDGGIVGDVALQAGGVALQDAATDHGAAGVSVGAREDGGAGPGFCQGAIPGNSR
jgi:hypothetical protein